ncbi:MAG: Ig-like domain-containing protein [Candidatus Omnitrophica bacterium]|nr:Ig-like domain-containing protein [Candidatus Omnitrophota bacterium]
MITETPGARQYFPRPPMPVINNLPSLLNRRFITIEGMKCAGTSVLINGEIIVPLDAEKMWSVSGYDLSWPDGQKRITATSKDEFGQESAPFILSITLDTIIPRVKIAAPADGASLETSPINVSGTIDEPCDVTVNGVEATVDNLTFRAENIDLRYGQNSIKAEARDEAGNISSHMIAVNLMAASEVKITKLSPDVHRVDPTDIIAGSEYTLSVLLEIDGRRAVDQPLEFRIIQGNGSLSSSTVYTDSNGEAQNILVTDTHSSNTNLVEVFHRDFSDEKVTFHVDTRAGPPAKIENISALSIYSMPEDAVELPVKVTDMNGNPVPDEEIIYSVSLPSFSLSSSTTVTDSNGIAKATITTGHIFSSSCNVKAESSSEPSLSLSFVVTVVGVSEVIERVRANDELIRDSMADVTITSNAPWLAPETRIKMWEKGNKQKVQEIYPEAAVYIRPPAEEGPMVNMENTVVSYNKGSGIIIIKTVTENRSEEYPYQLDHIDYEKGIITKSERYVLDGDYLVHFITEYSDFINIGGIWGFRTMRETAFDSEQTRLYETTYTYSNIKINSGIPDSVFQE